MYTSTYRTIAVTVYDGSHISDKYRQLRATVLQLVHIMHIVDVHFVHKKGTNLQLVSNIRNMCWFMLFLLIIKTNDLSALVG